MKFLVSMFLLGACAAFVNALPQGLFIFNNGDTSEQHLKTSPRPRPYSPLPPMHLPPQFQHLGISLPPPPNPPLHISQVNPMQLQLGDINEQRFFFNFLQQLKPILFPWLATPSTASPTTQQTEASTTPSTEGQTSPTEPTE